MLVQSNSWNSVREFAEGHGQQIKSNQCCGIDNTYKVPCQCAAEHKQQHAHKIHYAHNHLKAFKG